MIVGEKTKSGKTHLSFHFLQKLVKKYYQYSGNIYLASVLKESIQEKHSFGRISGLGIRRSEF